jgi:DNA mismatch repair protein MutS
MFNLLNFNTLYDEYEYYLQKYSKEFGLDTVVCYQCGGFYEIYSINDGAVNTDNLADVLGIEVSKRNKNKKDVSRENCAMMGWPVHVMDKFVQLLVEHNYTIVIVNQIDKNKLNDSDIKFKSKLKGKDSVERFVSQIVSKGTYTKHLSVEEQSSGKYIMCICLEKIIPKFVNKTNEIMSYDDVYSFGVSVIDPSTGNSFFFEIPPNLMDPSLSLDELYRISLQYPPSELLLISNFSNTKSLSVLDVITMLDLKEKNVHVIDRLDKLDSKYTKASYQTHVISKTFSHFTSGLLTPIESVGLELVYYARISYIFLLDYLLTHNECLVQKIEKPLCQSEEHGKRLIMSFNAAKQLDLDSSLLQLLNNCKTLMGKRYFRYRLMNPTFDVEQLKKSYEWIAFNLSKTQEGEFYFNLTRNELKNVSDVERIFRKITTQNASISEFIRIKKSFIAVSNIIDTCFSYIDNSSPLVDNIKELIACKCNMKLMVDFIDSKFENESENNEVLSSLGVFSYFNKNLLQIDDNNNILDNLINCKTKLDTLVTELNKYISSNLKQEVNHFKLERNERDGFYITCTSKRLEEFQKYNLKNKFKFEDFEFTNTKVKSQTTLEKIKHSYVDKLSVKINNNIQIWETKARKIIFEINQSFVNTFFNEFKNISDSISSIDFITTCAFNAHTLRYCRPDLKENKENPFINCTNLRHPIVEKLNDKIPFIGNDISLGDGNSKGMLLYGLNASGKSTLMKSIALSIIMAQSGMYTPAHTFCFSPYKQLFSRITQGDSIQKGQSTFMIEMQELRNILNRSNRHSLVIGDELCSGTESLSALGIVSAGLINLCTKNESTFIFTSHLHELTSVPQILKLQEQNLIDICHLHVEVNPETKKLVYDRKLRKGQGLSVYGIEVCKALNLNQDFINLANDIRLNYSNTNCPKISRYNSKMIIDKCAVCKQPATEVHHIKQQKDADEYGYIEDIHKNRLSNLISLCESCHTDVHNKTLYIEGYQLSSNGIELIVNKESNEKKHIQKMNEKKQDLEEKVRDMRFHKKMSLQAICKETCLSVYKLRKLF